MFPKTMQLPCSLLFLTPALALAAPPPLTWDTVADRVRRSNPVLAAERSLLNEVTVRSSQAGRLSNPELEIEIEGDGAPTDAVEVGVSQPFSIASRRRHEKELGVLATKQASVSIKKREAQLVGEARKTLLHLLVAKERRELLQRQQKLAQELASFINQVAQRGEASVIDAGQARLEAARYATELRQLAADERGLLGMLKELLGLEANDPLPFAGALPSPELPAKAAPDSTPAVLQADLSVETAQRQRDLERARRYQALSAGVYVRDEPDVDAVIIGLRFALPLPLWDRNQGPLQAAEIRTTRKEQERDAVRHRLRLQLATSREQMREWLALIRDIDDDLLPQATRQTTLSEAAWRDGQGDLLTVFRSREQQLELALSRLHALEQFHEARVRFQTLLARP